MFSLKEKFQFLENGIDFPFYNDTPKLSSGNWLLLLGSVILTILIIDVIHLPENINRILFILVTLLPILYVCKGNYGLFFKKPKLMDFLTIILCYFGYLVYGFLIVLILHVIGYQTSGDIVLTSFTNPNAFVIILNIIQLLGEEFFKITILLIVMYVVYKYTNNRSLAIGLGIFVTLFVFGMAHATAYGGKILQILLLQGLGSIFDLYAYMKTKNIVVSYLLHLLIDYSVFITTMLHCIM